MTPPTNGTEALRRIIYLSAETNEAMDKLSKSFLDPGETYIQFHRAEENTREIEALALWIMKGAYEL